MMELNREVEPRLEGDRVTEEREEAKRGEEATVPLSLELNDRMTNLPCHQLRQLDLDSPGLDLAPILLEPLNHKIKPYLRQASHLAQGRLPLGPRLTTLSIRTHGMTILLLEEVLRLLVGTQGLQLSVDRRPPSGLQLLIPTLSNLPR